MYSPKYVHCEIKLKLYSGWKICTLQICTPAENLLDEIYIPKIYTCRKLVPQNLYPSWKSVPLQEIYTPKISTPAGNFHTKMEYHQ